MVETVRKPETMLTDSLLDKKQLIVSSVHSLIDHRFIGFIFVKHLEFSPGKPDERIEPVQDGDDREQQHVHRMALPHVAHLVRQDHRGSGEVLTADHNMPQETE